MIQILGLREFFNSKTDKHEKKETFFSKGWRSPSVIELLADPDQVIAQIPQDMRWNLYYTVADCFEEKGRKLKEQWTMPFDIDGMEHEKALEVAEAGVTALGLEWNKTGIVFSGNGVQILVAMQAPIVSDSFFNDNRHHYKELVRRIDAELFRRGLKGKADPTVFSPARLMRLPNTENRKKDKETRHAVLLQGHMEPVDFDITKLSGIPDVMPDEQIAPAVLQKFPKADTEAVLTECEFLKYCGENQGKVSELQWYGMLSITARLENGKALSHTMSEKHPGYSASETESKIEQALNASGPRTCANINGLWGNCHTCKHFEKIKSPILIRGPKYIKTQDTGFHNIRLDSEGNPKPGKPCYTDLLKFYDSKAPRITMADSTLTYKYNGTHWEEVEKSDIQGFAQAHFDPPADNKMCAEFLGLVKRTNLKPPGWFNNSTFGKMNFRNGVLDMNTMEFGPHSENYGFRAVLPYDYDPLAVAPRFTKFLEEVTLGDIHLQQILTEYMGYALSSDDCWAHKALIMYGEGSNGKSKFLETLKLLAGEQNYASVTLKGLQAMTTRYLIDGKLFNIAEENGVGSLGDNDVFKLLVAGGVVQAKKLFVQEYEFENRCKLVISCNDIPKSSDKTDGFYRRMLLVPFRAKFDDASGNKDPFLMKKLKDELPGILNIAIAGYRRLKAQEAFTESTESKVALEEFKQENDPFLNWFLDQVEIGTTESRVPKDEMFEAFKKWCESNEERKIPMSVFGRRLKQKLGKDCETKGREGEKRIRYINGVTLRSDY